MYFVSSSKFTALISLILILSLNSCGGKREKEKDNNLTVLSAAIGDLNSVLPGGLIIYAHESTKDLSYSFHAYTGHSTLELDNGNWTFWAVGWKGGSSLVGPVRCGKTSMNLEGGDGTLALLMNDSRCDDIDFAAAAFRSSSQFKALKLVTCNSLAGVSAGTSNCSGTKGPAGSYKIKLPQFDGPDSSAYLSGTSGIEVCVADAAAGTGITTSSFLLPTGGSAIATSFLTTIVEVHTDATCTALEDSYTFPNGITDTVVGQASTDVKIYDDTSETVLFLKPSNVVITNPTVALTTGAGSVTNAPYTVTSTFSENVTGVADADFSVVNGVASATAGAGLSYTTTITPSGQGAVNVTFNAAGANAVSDSDPNLISNTLVNTYDSIVPTISLNGMATITPSNEGSYTVSGSCSENTQTVTVSVGGQAPGVQPTCTVGSFSVTYDVSGAGDGGAVSITADHDDVAGNSATQASTTVVKDTVIPTVSISSSTNINNGNKATYSVNGTCSENAQTVTIFVGGVAPGVQPTCGNNGAGNYITSVDVTLVVDNASVSITADHDDAVGNSAVQDSTNVIKDTVTPTVSQVRSTKSDGSYGVGQVLDILIEFDEAITVTGTPQITLDNQGGGDFTVDYTSGSTSDTLTFQYTVGASQLSADLDYVATNSLALNGGTLNDAAGNASTLTLASPGAVGSISDNQNIVIDTSVPTVTEVKTSKVDSTYTTGEVIDIEVVFDEAVDVAVATPQLTLETGTTDAVVNYLSGTGSDTLTFRYTVSANEQSADLDYKNTTALALNGATIRDGSLNNATLTLATPNAINSISDNKAIVIDSVSPSVTEVDSTKADGSYKAGEVIDVRVIFDENVIVGGTPQLTLDFAADYAVNYSSGSGSNTLTFQYTVQAGHNSADLDYVATGSLALNAGTILDSAGNSSVLTLASPGAANSISDNKAIIVDTTVPTLTSVSIASNNANTAYAKVGDEVTVSFTTSETLTGSPTATIDGNVATIAGTNPNYTAKYTMQAADSEGALSFTIDFTDAAGNIGTQVTAVTDVSSVSFDETAPTLTPVVIASNNTNTALSKIGDEITVSFTVDEPLIANPSGTIDGNSATIAGTHPNFTAKYTMTGAGSEGVLTFTIDFTDVAGNSGTQVTAVTDGSSVTFDKTAPTLTSVGIVSNNTNNDHAKTGDLITLSFTVDESLISNPTVLITGNATSIGGTHPNYTATYTMVGGETEEALPFTIDFTDLAGNSGTQVTAVTDASSVTYDETNPTAPTVGHANGYYGASFNTSFTASTDTNANDYRYRLDGVVPTSCADGTSTGGGSVSIPVKTTNNTTQQLRVVACDMAGNMSTSASNTYTWLEPQTAHFYTNTSNWNEWVNNSTPGTAGAALCSGTGACMHGGQVLKIPVPELTSCTGLSASDNLGVFNWACDDAGSTSVTFTNHAGFLDTKGLGDLLNAASWKSLSLDVTGGSLLSTVSSKTSATIWGNTVGALPGSTTAGTRTSLATANKLYTHSTTDLLDASYDITADGVGVVNIGGGASEIRTANTYSAYDFNDLTITGGLDSSGLIVSKGRKYLWVESNFNCDSPNGSQTTDNGVYFHTTHYSTIHNTKIYDTLNWGLRFRDADYNMVTSLISEGHYDTAANSGASTGASIRLELGSDNNSFYKFDVYDAFAPIWIDNGASNKFKSFKVSYGNENGIYIGTGNANNFQDGIITSTFDTTFGQGIYTVGVSDTVFIGVTSANNDLNINLESSDSALLINTTIANGLDAADGGLLLDGTSMNNTFLRTVSVNNSIGLLFDHTNTLSYNSIYDLSVADNGVGININRANAREIIVGTIEFENNSTSCSGNGGQAGIDGSCLGTTGNSFTYVASSGVTSSNSFRGVQSTPTFASLLGTDGWINGLSIFEGLGENGGGFGAKAPCSSGCGVYDWRLISSASPLKAQFSAPPAANTAGDNITHTFVGSGATTFLRYATEVNPLDYHTFSGDQDGICENNEVCIINPNFGAYQGHGNLVDTPADTSSGTLNNIKLLQWDTNGL